MDPLATHLAANRRRARLLIALAVLACVSVPLIAGALLALVAGPVAILLGLAVGIALALVVTIPGWRGAETRTLSLIGGRPADPYTEARLYNLVDGLCTAAGLPRPELRVLDQASHNACAFGRDPRHGYLVVTAGLLDALDRIELEGVLAQELSRLRSRDTLPITTALGLCRPVAGLAGGLAVRLAEPPRLTARQAFADQAGVALTRYPPGLLAGLEKLQADPGLLTAPPVTGQLWIAPLEGRRETMEERIEALREL